MCHGKHHGPGQERGDAVQVRIGHGHGPFADPQRAGEAGRRRQAQRAPLLHAGLRPDRRGRQERRQDASGGQDAEPEGRTPGHPGVHRGQAQRGEQGPGAGGPLVARRRADRPNGARNRRRHRHPYEHEHRRGDTEVRELTPREIVAVLERHIVGQDDA